MRRSYRSCLTMEKCEISVPDSWIQAEKPGAKVLFKSSLRASSNLGITINPVKIPSLQEFGTVDDIAQRLLNAERQKVGHDDRQPKSFWDSGWIH